MTGYQTEKQWIHDALQKTWTAESGVTIRGWDDLCSTSGLGKNVRLNFISGDISTTTPGHDYLGVEVNGYSPGIRFALHESYQGSVRQFLIMADGVHEFGHAIGFAHEQNRDDTNRTLCTSETQGADGNYTFGPWDPDSIMNYCRIEMTNRYFDGTIDEMRLSGTDIWAAGAIYGAPFPYSVAVHQDLNPVTADLFARFTWPGGIDDLGDDWYNDSSGNWTLGSDPTGDGKPATSEPAAIDMGGGKSWVFIRTSTGSVALYDTSSRTWQDLGGYVVGQPVVAKAASRIVVMARNYMFGLSFREYYNGAWQPWTTKAADFVGVPAAMGAGGTSSVIHVFVTGADGNMWWMESPSFGNWPGFIAIPGESNFVGSPAIAVQDLETPNLAYVFAKTANGQLQYNIYSSPFPAPKYWNGWAALPTIPGGVQGSPTVINRVNGDYSIYVTDVDGNLWNIWKDPTSSAFSSGRITGPGGAIAYSTRLIGSPTGVKIGPNEMQIFARGTDHSTLAVTWKPYLRFVRLNPWTFTTLGNSFY